VEDNAHGLFGSHRGRPLGSWGKLAALSFHETKNFTCGEGGALIINDPALVERAMVLRDKGTDRHLFLRGEVPEYTWVDVGSSYLLSDVLAAYLYAQLESREQILSRRRRAWEFYRDELKDWAASHDVILPKVPSYDVSSFHMFHLVLPSRKSRDAAIRHLRHHGILSVFHYQPLHLSSMGRKFGGRPGQCPVAEDVSGRLLRLPFYNDLADDDLHFVAETLRRFDPARD
jgi:dTDP-4-amino-4,6-dideoxygalactose transaminase